MAELDLGEQDRMLRAYDVDLIPRELAADVDAAVAAAHRLGWPIALKAATRDRLTRSTASGVVLDVADEAQLRTTWQRMWDALGPAMLPVVVQRFSDSGWTWRSRCSATSSARAPCASVSAGRPGSSTSTNWVCCP